MPFNEHARQAMLRDMERLSNNTAPRTTQVWDRDKFATLWGSEKYGGICLPGRRVHLRLLPRWDGDENKLVYVEAYEHWFNLANGGRRTRVWCPKTHERPGRPVACALCDIVDNLRQSASTQQEIALVRDLQRQRMYLFNALIRSKQDENGKWMPVEYVSNIPNIKILKVHAKLFRMLMDKMLGMSDPETSQLGFAALGPIYDPGAQDGRDIIIHRPAKGEREYRLEVANVGSPLFKPGDVRWGEWEKRLFDLDAEIALDKMAEYAELYKQYTGHLPETAPSSPEDEPEPDIDTTDDEDYPAPTPLAESEYQPEGFGDPTPSIVMPDPTPSAPARKPTGRVLPGR